MHWRWSLVLLSKELSHSLFCCEVFGSLVLLGLKTGAANSISQRWIIDHTRAWLKPHQRFDIALYFIMLPFKICNCFLSLKDLFIINSIDSRFKVKWRMEEAYTRGSSE